MKKNPNSLKRSELLSEKIEEKILTGEYPPGTRLDEQELADRFEVSRTPIREVLIYLASTGLIEIRPRRGAVVPELDAEKLSEMFEVMAELEALCGRLAARRMTLDELERLKESLAQCQHYGEVSDIEKYYLANETFHQTIYDGSHNGFLVDQVKTLQKRLRPYRRLQLRVRHRLTESFKEHQQIVEAITAGEADKAAGLIRAHVVVQGERFSDLVASLRAEKK